MGSVEIVNGTAPKDLTEPGAADDKWQAAYLRRATQPINL
jgi:hypothetical protein